MVEGDYNGSNAVDILRAWPIIIVVARRAVIDIILIPVLLPPFVEGSNRTFYGRDLFTKTGEIGCGRVRFNFCPWNCEENIDEVIVGRLPYFVERDLTPFVAA